MKFYHLEIALSEDDGKRLGDYMEATGHTAEHLVTQMVRALPQFTRQEIENRKHVGIAFRVQVPADSGSSRQN